MSSFFGKILRVSAYGESHCKGVGAILDGCPPKLQLSEKDKPAKNDITRRKLGTVDSGT